MQEIVDHKEWVKFLKKEMVGIDMGCIFSWLPDSMTEQEILAVKKAARLLGARVVESKKGRGDVYVENTKRA